MMGMAKRTRATNAGQGAGPKRRNPPNRKGKGLSVYISQQLLDALEQHRGKTRRPRNTEIVIAIEQYLSSQGAWPPDQPQQSSSP